MHYIKLIELESMEDTTCKIQGLSRTELADLVDDLQHLKISSDASQEAFYEVDTQGITMLNYLAHSKYGYRVASQSMVIEKSNIGSRTIQTQKTVWTLYNENK